MSKFATSFVIEPYVGPLPLRFGMTPKEVASVIGPPTEVFPDFLDRRTEERGTTNIGYSAPPERLVEVVFVTEDVPLLVHGMNVFAASDPIAVLRQVDPNPLISVGMIFFPALGVRVSGYHDNDDSQKAIGIMSKEEFGDIDDDFEPFP